jgi:hypothetical protein
MPKEKQRHREQRRSSSDPKPVIAALFEQSGEIAPVDFRRNYRARGAAAAPPRRQSL